MRRAQRGRRGAAAAGRLGRDDVAARRSRRAWTLTRRAHPAVLDVPARGARDRVGERGGRLEPEPSRAPSTGSHTHPGARTCAASFRLSGRRRPVAAVTTSASAASARSAGAGTGTRRAWTPSARAASRISPAAVVDLRRREEEDLAARLGPVREEEEAARAVVDVDPRERPVAEVEREPGARDPEEEEVLAVAGPHDARRARHRDRQPIRERERDPLRLRLRRAVGLDRRERLVLARAACATARRRPSSRRGRSARGRAPRATQASSERARRAGVHPQELGRVGRAPDAREVEDQRPARAPPPQRPGVGRVAGDELDARQRERRAPAGARARAPGRRARRARGRAPCRGSRRLR